MMYADDESDKESEMDELEGGIEEEGSREFLCTISLLKHCVIGVFYYKISFVKCVVLTAVCM